VTTEDSGAHRQVSGEQLAIALTAESLKLYGIAERRGSSDHDVAAYQLAGRLAGWAKDVQQMSVLHFKTLGALAERLNANEQKLVRVRDGLTKLEMARSDDPNMALAPLLTVLADFVEAVEEALDE
jgi:hypothetical protein